MNSFWLVEVFIHNEHTDYKILIIKTKILRLYLFSSSKYKLYITLPCKSNPKITHRVLIFYNSRKIYELKIKLQKCLIIYMI